MLLRTLFRNGLRITGWLCIALAVAYGATVGYLSWREQDRPSTRRVLQLADGRQIPLVQPAPASLAPASAAPASRARTGAVAAPSVLLPPERISLPSIATSWPVVLSDNDNLPQFKGVGWLFGSAFPGQPGNMVLFGHLGGPYATFSQLHELAPGHEFSVATADAVFHYRVRERFETTPDDVAVLAPTTNATATLITCSGPWDAVAQTNERRMIVIADLIEPEPVGS